MILGIRWLNLRHLRRQPLRACLALLAVAAGVALVVAVFSDSRSVSAASTRFARQVAGPAPIRIVGTSSRGGVDERTVVAVAHVPGVEAAVPAVQAVTVAETAAGHQRVIVAFGFDCRMEALIGRFGCSPAALSRISLSTPPLTSPTLLRTVGPAGAVRTDSGRIGFAGAVTIRRLDTVNSGQVAIFALRSAQVLFDRVGRVDVIYVRPSAGAPLAALRARLGAVAGPQNVVLGATQSAPGPSITGALQPLLSLVALLALLTAVLLIFNIVTLSLAERRKDLAISAAVGASSRLIVGGAIAESVVLGLGGGLLGVGGGLLLARPMVASLSRFTQRVIGVHVSLVVSPSVAVLGAALGVFIAVAAAIVPARRACRLDVAGELYNRTGGFERAPGRAVGGATAFAVVGLGGVFATALAARHGGLRAWAPPLDLVGVVLSFAGLIAAVGAAVPVVCQWLHARLASRRLAGLAMANLAREGRRTAAMAIAVGTTVGLATILAANAKSIHDASTSMSIRNLDGRLAVSTLPFNGTSNVEGKVPSQLLARLARIPGVAAVSRSVSLTTVEAHTSRVVTVVASDEPTFPYKVVAGPPAPVSFTRGEVLVGDLLARRDHLRPGSDITLNTPTGPIALHVGAIWDDIVGNGDSVTVPMSIATSGWGPQPPDAVDVTPATGVAIDRLALRIRAAHLDPGLRVETPVELAKDTSRDVTTYLAPFWTLQRALVLVALLAVLSTLLLVGAQRRRELGTLAAVGLAPNQLAGLGMLEALGVGVLGSVLAAAAAVPINEALVNNAIFLVGFRPPFRYEPSAPLLYAVLAIAVTLAGGALPAWRMAHTSVVESLRCE